MTLSQFTLGRGDVDDNQHQPSFTANNCPLIIFRNYTFSQFTLGRGDVDDNQHQPSFTVNNFTFIHFSESTLGSLPSRPRYDLYQKL